MAGHNMTRDLVLIKSQQMRPIPEIQDTDQYWQSCEVDAFNKQRETPELQIRVLCTRHHGKG